jgi:DNA-binding CsgD family transcriptional regulator
MLFELQSDILKNPNTDVLIHELKRLSDEARLQAKSKRPDIALMRLSYSLASLLKSLESKPVGKSPLTKREMEILTHVSQGFTNREIASALSISEKTIEFHLNSIFTKTEASTRTEAVTNALKNRWLA